MCAHGAAGVASGRSQARNRQDARERLVELIRAAATPPKPRRPTKPPFASKVHRAEGKRRRSAVKSLRRVRIGDD